MIAVEKYANGCRDSCFILKWWQFIWQILL